MPATARQYRRCLGQALGRSRPAEPSAVVDCGPDRGPVPTLQHPQHQQRCGRRRGSDTEAEVWVVFAVDHGRSRGTQAVDGGVVPVRNQRVSAVDVRRPVTQARSPCRWWLVPPTGPGDVVRRGGRVPTGRGRRPGQKSCQVPLEVPWLLWKFGGLPCRSRGCGPDVDVVGLTVARDVRGVVRSAARDGRRRSVQAGQRAGVVVATAVNAPPPLSPPPLSRRRCRRRRYRRRRYSPRRYHAPPLSRRLMRAATTTTTTTTPPFVRWCIAVVVYRLSPTAGPGRSVSARRRSLVRDLVLAALAPLHFGRVGADAGNGSPG